MPTVLYGLGYALFVLVVSFVIFIPTEEVTKARYDLLYTIVFSLLFIVSGYLGKISDHLEQLTKQKGE